MMGDAMFKEAAPEVKAAAKQAHRKYILMQECPECGFRFRPNDDTEVYEPVKEEK